jgi:hypothetical protein
MLFDVFCRCACALVLLTVIAPRAQAESLAPEATAEPRDVELFAAMEEGAVDVVLIPRDSKKVTIQVKNKTDKPLTVKLPEAFAGVPVLAQFQPPGGAAPQAIGMPGGGGGNPLFGGGVMNIPPGKIVKVKRPAVCLEHGKPEPGPRIAYRIAPLEEANDNDGVRELLTQYPFDRTNQRIAQLAAWHLANGKSWEELDGLTIKHINRQVTRQFSREEISAARKIVASLPSQNKYESKGEGREAQGESLSQR